MRAQILVSELGDETFIIAALMAMRHPRLEVFAGAASALAFMTVISAGLGLAVPGLISKSHTHAAATVLYTIFGLRLIWMGLRSVASEGESGVQEEIDEVEAKLDGGPANVPGRRTWWCRTLAQILTPVFIEAFVLTFLAEWGDRSQIATITLATHKDPVGVAFGGVLGHMICTGLAVVGGRLVALQISQRTLAFLGGALFLAFAVHNVLVPEAKR